MPKTGQSTYKSDSDTGRRQRKPAPSPSVAQETPSGTTSRRTRRPAISVDAASSSQPTSPRMSSGESTRPSSPRASNSSTSSTVDSTTNPTTDVSGGAVPKRIKLKLPTGSSVSSSPKPPAVSSSSPIHNTPATVPSFKIKLKVPSNLSGNKPSLSEPASSSSRTRKATTAVNSTVPPTRRHEILSPSQSPDLKNTNVTPVGGRKAKKSTSSKRVVAITPRSPTPQTSVGSPSSPRPTHSSGTFAPRIRRPVHKVDEEIQKLFHVDETNTGSSSASTPQPQPTRNAPRQSIPASHPRAPQQPQVRKKPAVQAKPAVIVPQPTTLEAQIQAAELMVNMSFKEFPPGGIYEARRIQLEKVNQIMGYINQNPDFQKDDRKALEALFKYYSPTKLKDYLDLLYKFAIGLSSDHEDTKKAIITM
ncbi:hypothetical protein HDU76_005642, partial [Blyttiomyces sp. JEL0837]